MSEAIKKTSSRAEVFLAATVEVLKNHYRAGRLSPPPKAASWPKRAPRVDRAPPKRQHRASTKGRGKTPGPSSCPYSPNLVEGAFSKVRAEGVLAGAPETATNITRRGDAVAPRFLDT
jgi:hypothetical protein